MQKMRTRTNAVCVLVVSGKLRGVSVDAEYYTKYSEELKKHLIDDNITGLKVCGDDGKVVKYTRVVRCADCQHSYEDLGGRVCAFGACVDCVVSDDFYCAYGAEKR